MSKMCVSNYTRYFIGNVIFIFVITKLKTYFQKAKQSTDAFCQISGHCKNIYFGIISIILYLCA